MENGFYNKIQIDSRVCATHISLYFALLDEQGLYADHVIRLKPAIIMLKAKISSRVTYNKRMRELHLYGFISYVPSFTPGESLVRMIEL